MQAGGATFKKRNQLLCDFVSIFEVPGRLCRSKVENSLKFLKNCNQSVAMHGLRANDDQSVQEVQETARAFALAFIRMQLVILSIKVSPKLLLFKPLS